VDGDGLITVGDFLLFLDVTRIRFSRNVGKTFLERYFPRFAASSHLQLIRAVVTYKYTNPIIDIVVATLVTVNLSMHGRDLHSFTRTNMAVVNTLIVIVIFEACVKLMVRGGVAYKRSFRNRIDFVVAAGALVSWFAAACYGPVSHVNGLTIAVRVFLLLRLFLFPRNLRYWFEKRGLKRFARLMRRVLAKTLTLGIVFSCTGFFFATVGLYAFGGTVGLTPASNPQYDALIDSSYGQQNFYALNFNDFMSACITLFCCLHVSDFDTIATGFAAVTSQSAKLYFILWYVVGTLLMLNILKSFVLGEFLALFLAPALASQQQHHAEKDSGAEVSVLHMHPEAASVDTDDGGPALRDTYQLPAQVHAHQTQTLARDEYLSSDTLDTHASTTSSPGCVGKHRSCFTYVDLSNVLIDFLVFLVSSK